LLQHAVFERDFFLAQRRHRNKKAKGKDQFSIHDVIFSWANVIKKDNASSPIGLTALSFVTKQFENTLNASGLAFLVKILLYDVDRVVDHVAQSRNKAAVLGMADRVMDRIDFLGDRFVGDVAA
jgi:hypothetical protein